MPLVKISELEGAALDWAVAKCEGKKIFLDRETPGFMCLGEMNLYRFSPTTYWAQGGPIIEREIRDLGMDLWSRCYPVPDGMCAATYGRGAPDCYVYGPTPLIAAMRCYVASRLGDEVEIPEELT